MRLEARKSFSCALSVTLGADGTGACGRGHVEGQDSSWGEPNLISDFLQEIVIRAVSLSAASTQKLLALNSIVRRLAA
jgi:hypothetical protein